MTRDLVVKTSGLSPSVRKRLFWLVENYLQKEYYSGKEGIEKNSCSSDESQILDELKSWNHSCCEQYFRVRADNIYQNYPEKVIKGETLLI